MAKIILLGAALVAMCCCQVHAAESETCGSKPKPPSSLKLFYFDAKGRGESIRLICSFAGIELEDHRFADREEFLTLKESGESGVADVEGGRFQILPFGQVPVLQVDGSELLSQTNSILRYLGKLGGLYPSDPLLAARVDAALDHEVDTFMAPSVATYPARYGVGMDDAQKGAMVEVLGNEVMPRHLGNLEKMLARSSTGWIAGTQEPSPADFAWACRLAQFITIKEDLFPEAIRKLEGYPGLQAFVDKFFAHPKIKDFYSKQA